MRSANPCARSASRVASAIPGSFDAGTRRDDQRWVDGPLGPLGTARTRVTLDALLRVLARSFSASGTPYMITGSVAAAYHGAARATMDLDAVIDPTPAQLRVLVQIPEDAGLYVSADAAHQALADPTMFNVIDPETGWQADLIVRQHRPFSDEEFARQLPTELLGQRVAVAALEDVILSKLEWATLGDSARQFEDVRRAWQSVMPR